MERFTTGREQALALAYAASVPEDGRIIDMGAGKGESVEVLRKRGMEAVGIDLKPGSELVEEGDLLHTGFESESFDAVLSQGAFYESGDVRGAIMEASRLLKKGGKLLLSDVCFTPWKKDLEDAGLRVISTEDMTRLWQAYYVERLWRGEDVPDSFGEDCKYLVVIAEKE